MENWVREFVSLSPSETEQMGCRLGRRLTAGSVLAIRGNLGSGKTVFVKGLAEGLGIDPGFVRSPTFSLIQEHRGKKRLCHADLYRLVPEEVKNIGLEEYWRGGSEWVVAVEWADRAENLVPAGALTVAFESLSKNRRKIIFSGAKPWQKILRQLKKS